jgi:hypothetical protein
MPRHPQKNRVNNSQDNMSPSEPSNPTTVGPEKYNTAETQNKDFKIAFNEYVRDP